MQWAPSEALARETERVREAVRRVGPDVALRNGTNDYRTYGRALNARGGAPVVSIALEPAIHPYHRIGEGVRLADIERVERVAATLLRNIALGKVTLSQQAGGQR
jgi:hypothetical protein